MDYYKIGTIRTNTGNILTDDDGMEYNETVAIDGYHVNTLPPLAVELEPFVVVVNSPKAVYAGRDDTICLKFKDEAEWLALGLEPTEDIL